MTHEEAYQEARRRIAAARAQRLVTLDLTNLLWDRFPPELFELAWLERLGIERDIEIDHVRSALHNFEFGYGMLTQLPAEFGSLKALRALNISNHRIADLTPLAGLSQLRELVCGLNRLTDLTPLAGLTGLQNLDCRGNRLTELEPVRPAIRSGQIKIFFCDGNPVGGLPAELLGSGNVAEALRGYWRELEQGSEPNRDVKVILVGNGQVGKTTLSYGLKHGRPPPHEITERTHGIVIEELPLELAKGETLRLRLWDCGGQELYHATHRLFLHHDALYLLLWAEETDEPPEEPSHPASYWLGHLRELAGESPVILVKNKIDRFNQRAYPPILRANPGPSNMI